MILDKKTLNKMRRKALEELRAEVKTLYNLAQRYADNMFYDDEKYMQFFIRQVWNQKNISIGLIALQINWMSDYVETR